MFTSNGSLIISILYPVNHRKHYFLIVESGKTACLSTHYNLCNLAPPISISDACMCTAWNGSVNDFWQHVRQGRQPHCLHRNWPHLHCVKSIIGYYYRLLKCHFHLLTVNADSISAVSWITKYNPLECWICQSLFQMDLSSDEAQGLLPLGSLFKTWSRSKLNTTASAACFSLQKN